MLLHACSHIDVYKVPGLGFMNHADILISSDHCGIRQAFCLSGTELRLVRNPSPAKLGV